MVEFVFVNKKKKIYQELEGDTKDWNSITYHLICPDVHSIHRLILVNYFYFLGKYFQAENAVVLGKDLAKPYQVMITSLNALLS